MFLKGTVASQAGKARAAEIARATDGVTRVENELRVGVAADQAPNRDSTLAHADADARATGHDTKDAAHDAKKSTKEAAKDTKNATQDAAADVREEGREAHHDANESAHDVKHHAENTAKDVAHDTSEATGTAGQAVSDGWITTKVKSSFVGVEALDGSDINVDTNAHVVTLRGTVPSAAARAKAVSLAKQVEGVRSVKDDLTMRREEVGRTGIGGWGWRRASFGLHRASDYTRALGNDDPHRICFPASIPPHKTAHVTAPARSCDNLPRMSELSSVPDLLDRHWRHGPLHVRAPARQGSARHRVHANGGEGTAAARARSRLGKRATARGRTIRRDVHDGGVSRRRAGGLLRRRRRARRCAPGSILVDMTTTEPSLAIQIAGSAAEQGATALDAPVSGGDVGARNATLSIMAGGDAGALERVRPLLEAMGKTIVHEGGPGAGQHTKMCNQIVIAGTMIGVCESLLYGARAGLDLQTMLQSIRGGAAGCWTLENLAPRVLNGNFDPGFMVEHFIKDMGIALDEAARMRLALPGLALVRQLYLATAAQGHARLGTHALYLALRQLSGG